MTADEIVAEARRWIGTPYRHQASLIGIGCDCLGLLRGVWRAVLGEEPEAPPPYAPDWTADVGAEPLVEAARRHLLAAPPGPVRAGDVLLFRFRPGLAARHCAIATGAGAMVHAHAGASVAEVAIQPWWARHRSHVFRFPNLCPNLPED